MSGHASRVVWSARISPPTRKLVALALADYLNEDTGKLNPSLQALADKVGVTRGQAQRVVRELIEGGLVSVIANRNGGKPGTTPSYQLNLDRFAELAATDGADAAPTDGADAVPTDGTHAAPTDGAGAARENPTNGAGAEDGWRPCTGRVAPMHETGGAYATLTIRNHKRTIKEQGTTASKPASSSKPDDVDAQVWMDWCSLRKSKRAPITETVMTGARNEAGKASMSLEQFLRIWCVRGSQGLQAEWLKPSERAAARNAGFASKDYTKGVNTDGSFA